jgi:hypothetical protein
MRTAKPLKQQRPSIIYISETSSVRRETGKLHAVSYTLHASLFGKEPYAFSIWPSTINFDL